MTDDGSLKAKQKDRKEQVDFTTKGEGLGNVALAQPVLDGKGKSRLSNH